MSARTPELEGSPVRPDARTPGPSDRGGSWGPPFPSPGPGFSLLRPTTHPLPILVEVPHAGLSVDPLAMASLHCPVSSLGRDADLFMDLACAPLVQAGALVLISHVSRYVCDLNRAPTAFEPAAAPGGTLSHAPHGLFWLRTTEGHPALRAPLDPAEAKRRLATYYHPYHAALAHTLEQLRAQFGFALLLCAHSMPSPGRGGHPGQAAPLADIVPGSRGGTSAHPSVIAVAERAAQRCGFSLRHDVPYAGGYSTAHYGSPTTGIHALQLEVNRERYMNEATLELEPRGFGRVCEYLREVLRDWSALDPIPLRGTKTSITTKIA